MKKKYVGIILMLALAGTALAGCSFAQKDQTPPAAPETSQEAPAQENQNNEEQKQEEQKPEEQKQDNKTPSKNKENPNKKNNAQPATNNENTKKENNNQEYKKLSGKFSIELPNKDTSKLNDKEKEFAEALKKELEKIVYEFNENGTFVISGIQKISGKFEQTKDKIIISDVAGDSSKKEFNYSYDGNTLKLVQPNSKEELVFKRK